jgi:hypothetical protein
MHILDILYQGAVEENATISIDKTLSYFALMSPTLLFYPV